MKTYIKAIAILFSVVVAALLGAFVQDQLAEPVVVIEEKLIPVEVPVYINNTVIETVEVEVEKIVEVDNGNLHMVLEYVLNEDVLLVTDGLADDELSKLMDRIAFLGETKTVAEAHTSRVVADLVHEEVVSGTRIFKEDIKWFTVEEAVLSSIDFSDLNATAVTPVRFRMDDNLYLAQIEIIFEEGKVVSEELLSLAQI